MPLLNSYTLATAGTTGNNTHTGVSVSENLGDRRLALQFTISATGASATVDFKYQGTFDNTNWVDVSVLPADSSTTAVTTTKTALGTYVHFVDVPKRYEAIRLVTANNTAVTYGATLFVME